MTQSQFIIVVAPDPGFRHSIAFALASEGFAVTSDASMAQAFDSSAAHDAACAVVDDAAIVDWKRAHVQFARFGRPVVVLGSIFSPPPPRSARVRPLAKPFLGEPLIEAVRAAIAGRV